MDWIGGEGETEIVPVVMRFTRVSQSADEFFMNPRGPERISKK